MTSRSNVPDEPDVAEITCDGCYKPYLELSVLVWGRRNGLVGRLLCLECDPIAEKQPRLSEGRATEAKD